MQMEDRPAHPFVNTFPDSQRVICSLWWMWIRVPQVLMTYKSQIISLSAHYIQTWEMSATQTPGKTTVFGQHMGSNDTFMSAYVDKFIERTYGYGSHSPHGMERMSIKALHLIRKKMTFINLNLWEVDSRYKQLKWVSSGRCLASGIRWERQSSVKDYE